MVWVGFKNLDHHPRHHFRGHLILTAHCYSGCCFADSCYYFGFLSLHLPHHCRHYFRPRHHFPQLWIPLYPLQSTSSPRTIYFHLIFPPFLQVPLFSHTKTDPQSCCQFTIHKLSNAFLSTSNHIRGSTRGCSNSRKHQDASIYFPSLDSKFYVVMSGPSSLSLSTHVLGVKATLKTLLRHYFPR